jgi:hypothetical protein
MFFSATLWNNDAVPRLGDRGVDGELGLDRLRSVVGHLEFTVRATISIV